MLDSGPIWVYTTFPNPRSSKSAILADLSKNQNSSYFGNFGLNPQMRISGIEVQYTEL